MPCHLCSGACQCYHLQQHAAQQTQATLALQRAQQRSSAALSEERRELQAQRSLQSADGGKPFVSYDENDVTAKYGFPRKRRVGGKKNGSDAVRVCLTWQPQTAADRDGDEGREGVVGEEELSDEDEADQFSRPEGSPFTATAAAAAAARPRYHTVGERRARERFDKIGHPASQELLAQQAALAHSCRCPSAHELLLIKEDLAKQRVLEQVARERKQAEEAEAAAVAAWKKKNADCWRVCPCGCVSFGKLLANSGAPATCLSCNGPQRAVDMEAHRAQMQQAQEEQFEEEEKQQQQQQHGGHGGHNDALESLASSQASRGSQSSRGGVSMQQDQPAPPSTSRPSKATQSGGGGGGGVGAIDVGVQKNPPPAARSLRHSPHDPRNLHDPSLLDPVWQRRQAARQRAQRRAETLGTRPHSSGPDGEQAKKNEMKQLARRLKIQSFERKHLEERLAKTEVDELTLTRGLPDTLMSVLVGKPSFCAYGNGSTAPASGGLMYGNYMASYNVLPEKYPNHPETRQVRDASRRVARSRKKKEKEGLAQLQQLQAAALEEEERGVTNNNKPLERAMVWDGTASTGPRDPFARMRASGSADLSASVGAASARNRSVQSTPRHQKQPPALTIAQLQAQRAAPGGDGSVPMSQVAQHGNVRNAGTGAMGDPSSFAQQQQQHHLTASASMRASDSMQAPSQSPFRSEPSPRLSMRRGQYADGTIGGNNTLADTTARTMSVLPQPEKQTTYISQQQECRPRGHQLAASY